MASEKDKAAKSKQDGAEAKATQTEQASEPARQPADPRLKVIKKLEKRFQPRGPLRDRARDVLARWNSEADRESVTLEELQSLLSDWRADQARRKNPQAAAQA